MNEQADYEAEVNEHLVHYVERMECECYQDCVSDLALDGEDPEEFASVVAQVFDVDEDKVWEAWNGCHQAAADSDAERRSERRGWDF